MVREDRCPFDTFEEYFENIKSQLDEMVMKRIERAKERASLRSDVVPVNSSIESSFALLVIQTANGDIFIRPIGGDWHGGINDAVEEVRNMYPDAKMRLYEDMREWGKYFINNDVSIKQVIV